MLDTPNHSRVVVPVALRALEAQRLVNLIAFKVSPAVAAGLIAYAHTDELGSSVLVATAILAALQLVDRSTLPLGLMPTARLALGLLAPVLGAAAAAWVLAAGQGLPLADFQAPVAGAWLIMALGAWVTTRFDDDRRVRVAVIGSPGFASDLAEELDAAGIRAYEVIGWFGRGRPVPTRRGWSPVASATSAAWKTFARPSWRGGSSCWSAGVQSRPMPARVPIRIATHTRRSRIPVWTYRCGCSRRTSSTRTCWATCRS